MCVVDRDGATGQALAYICRVEDEGVDVPFDDVAFDVAQRTFVVPTKRVAVTDAEKHFVIAVEIIGFSGLPVGVVVKRCLRDYPLPVCVIGRGGRVLESADPELGIPGTGRSKTQSFDKRVFPGGRDDCEVALVFHAFDSEVLGRGLGGRFCRVPGDTGSDDHLVEMAVVDELERLSASRHRCQRSQPYESYECSSCLIHYYSLDLMRLLESRFGVPFHASSMDINGVSNSGGPDLYCRISSAF